MPAAQPTVSTAVLCKVWMGPLGTALLPPTGLILHHLTQGWWEMGWMAGQCPEHAKVMSLLMVLKQSGPERVKRRAPPSRYISLLLDELPSSLCGLCLNKTKRVGAFQVAASQKVGCWRAVLCWDPGLGWAGHSRGSKQQQQQVGAITQEDSGTPL